MSSDPDDESPRVPVVCPECETTSRLPLSDLEDAISRHNDRLHDGEDVAEVDPAITERLSELVIEDLGLMDEE